MPTAPPASPGYPAGFVRGLHRAGIVSGALTFATAALLAAAAMAGQTARSAAIAADPAHPDGSAPGTGA